MWGLADTDEGKGDRADDAHQAPFGFGRGGRIGFLAIEAVITV